MQYFSEKDGLDITSKSIISNNEWRGIIAAIKEQINNDSLSKDFPLCCPDGNGICGIDENLLGDSLRAVVPGISYPFSDINQEMPFESNENNILKSQKEQYYILDVIEFIYMHLHDAIKDKNHYHEYFHHYELQFIDTNIAKNSFRENINDIFRRNGTLFELNTDGHIQRIVEKGISELIKTLPSINDKDTKEMLSVAIDKFLEPKKEERKIGLEKLWDIFERIKTLLISQDKKKSTQCLIKKISEGNESIENILNNEYCTLTKIGNDFQIRHFEANKVPIDRDCILDYLFFRMLSLIRLMMPYCEDITE